MAPMLATACAALPSEGELRLRPGEAGSATPAGEEVTLMRLAGRLASL